MFAIRWMIARWLVNLAFTIAPSGPERNLFVRALNEAGEKVLRND